MLGFIPSFLSLRHWWVRLRGGRNHTIQFQDSGTTSCSHGDSSMTSCSLIHLLQATTINRQKVEPKLFESGNEIVWNCVLASQNLLQPTTIHHAPIVWNCFLQIYVCIFFHFTSTSPTLMAKFYCDQLIAGHLIRKNMFLNQLTDTTQSRMCQTDAYSQTFYLIHLWLLQHPQISITNYLSFYYKKKTT